MEEGERMIQKRVRLTNPTKKYMTVPKFLGLIKKSIMAEPRFYNQRAILNKDRKPSCNTPACIAGWMEYYLHGKCEPYEKVHAEIFGHSGWPWLFNSHFEGGPKEITELWKQVQTPELKAAVACYAIDTYAESKGVKLDGAEE